LFPEVKFVDRERDLAWDDDTNSYCQFVISKCNLPEDEDRKEWWSSAKKVVSFTLSQLRNDRNTAIRFAFSGMTSFASCFFI
jgi:hypothetical protein